MSRFFLVCWCQYLICGSTRAVKNMKGLGTLLTWGAGADSACCHSECWVQSRLELPGLVALLWHYTSFFTDRNVWFQCYEENCNNYEWNVSENVLQYFLLYLLLYWQKQWSHRLCPASLKYWSLSLKHYLWNKPKFITPQIAIFDLFWYFWFEICVKVRALF